MRSNDPYRLWVYSLQGAALDAAVMASIPVSQWSGIVLPLDTKFMEFAGWPMLPKQGFLTLSHNPGGNPARLWSAAWEWHHDRVHVDHAQGPSAAMCLARLWLLTVETVNREDRGKDDDNHFRTYMRPVSPPAQP